MLKTYGGHAAGEVPRLARVTNATPKAIINSEAMNKTVREIRLFFFMAQNYSEVSESIYSKQNKICAITNHTGVIFEKIANFALMDNLIGYDTPFFVSDVDSDSLRLDSPHLNGGRLFCYEGNATVTLDSTTYYLVANSSIAIIPGAAMSIVAVSDNFKGRKMVYTFEFFEQASRNLDGLFSFYLHHPFYIRTSAEVSSTYTILTILGELAKTKGPLMIERAVCLLRFLLMGVCEKISESHMESDNLSLTGQRVFQRFIFLLAAKHNEIKSVEGYASILGVTSKHLNSICRTQTGSTAKSVIDNTIISHIKAELNTSDKTISEISFLLGFNEPTEMCRFFRRIEGASPGEWREHHIVKPC